MSMKTIAPGEREFQVKVPNGRGCTIFTLPEKMFSGVFAPAGGNAGLSDAQALELVQHSLDNPIDSPCLEELSRGCRSAVVIISDHTRPVPSRIILPPMLARLRRNNPDIDITLLVATGCHRASRTEELKEKLGEDIFHRERIIIHDCDDTANLVRLGKLPSGGDLVISRLAAETDLLLAEGFIEPHFFAGFSGGRKSVLPGVAARTTVLANHCAEFIDSPFAAAGILENNPIHRDMASAARQAGLKFIVNVALDQQRRIAGVFAGAAEAAHAAGCEFVRKHSQIEVPVSDIVITGNGGYPLDRDIYQSVKSLSSAYRACRPGGVIIAACSCMDGHGGEHMYQTLKNSTDFQQLYRHILRVPAEETVPDQWQYQILLKVLLKCRVFFVTGDCPPELFSNMGMRCFASPEEALREAVKIVGDNARAVVIPDGVSVCVNAGSETGK